MKKVTSSFGKGARSKAPIDTCTCSVCQWLRGESRTYTTWNEAHGPRSPHRAGELTQETRY